jgi:hypothetical protein
MRFPNTEASEMTPTLPAGFVGLQVGGPGERPLGSPCVIAGAYRIPDPDAAQIGAPAHRGLVVAVTGLHYRCTAVPFRRALLFAEDEHYGAEGREGRFQIDLASAVPLRYPGRYFATVSLGAYLSNTVEIELR